MGSTSFAPTSLAPTCRPSSETTTNSIAEAETTNSLAKTQTDSDATTRAISIHTSTSALPYSHPKAKALAQASPRSPHHTCPKTDTSWAIRWLFVAC